MSANNILLWTLHNVCNKNSPLFFFFEIENHFFCQLGSFFILKGPKLECFKLPKSWKTQENIKPTLCYGHYVKTSHYKHHIIDINLLYYGHYDCMTLIIVILFGEINATCIPILFKFITPKFLVL